VRPDAYDIIALQTKFTQAWQSSVRNSKSARTASWPIQVLRVSVEWNCNRGINLKLKACHCCGLVHRVPPLSDRQEAECIRCLSTLDAGSRSADRSCARSFAAATGGLILYFPAILLPVLDIEKLGHHHASSILGGTWDLIRHGNLFVGMVVFLFSILLPLVKLLALLELSRIGLTHRRHRAWTYRIVEWTGRWSMMDVLLLALLVTLVKLGELVSFQLGPAVVAFVMCVVMSMIASIVFDPHAIWEESEQHTERLRANG
jgi:paraquat-inducible protein A